MRTKKFLLALGIACIAGGVTVSAAAKPAAKTDNAKAQAARNPAPAPKEESNATKKEDPAQAFSDGDSNFVKESLDQNKVHALYNNGDFEPVITVLEAFIKHNKTYSHSDSVFISKHLAVVYSANPATREKGKYYMFRLLELLPSAQLVDMYVSDEVDRIFDKVRQEFISRQHAFGIDTSRINLPDRSGNTGGSGDKGSGTVSKHHSWVPWTVAAAGGVALIGGYVAYMVNQDKPGVEPGPMNVNVVTPKN